MQQTNVLRVVDSLIDELIDAVRKHPNWPADIVHATAIMVEEAGEAMQAALDVYYHDGDIECLRTELAQTGAMCIRALVHLVEDK